jgi:2-oxoglutarate ferredoxin oxidoreductase subunit alpha
VAGIAKYIPEQTVEGPESGDLLVISWGGTYGSVRTAVRQCVANGHQVAHAHVKYLNPFPENLGEVISRYKHVFVPELNCGQLRFVLRATYLVDAGGYNKVQGKPFLVSELVEEIQNYLEGVSK